MNKKSNFQLKLFRLKIPFEETENLEENPDLTQDEGPFVKSNSRCVPVGTILITPDGCNEKKRFKGKVISLSFDVLPSRRNCFWSKPKRADST